MKIRSSDDRFTLEMSRDELGILKNALNETLECIEDWEYEIRMGVSIKTASVLLEELWCAYNDSNQKCFD